MEINWKLPEFRHRFREAINVLTDDWPDMEVVNAWFDSDDEDLQYFCAAHSVYYWMTGIGIIEAAYLLVEGALENANIDEVGRIAL